MRNVSPTGSMARKKRRLITTGMLMLFIALVIGAVAALLIIIPISIASWYQWVQLGVIGIACLLAIIGVINILRGWRFPVDHIYAAKAGEFLARFLDYRYTYIRNISRRGLGYVDAILVGPNGVLVFYFFTGKGTYRTQGNVWFQQAGGQLRTMGENPTQEAAKDVIALRQFLADHQLEQVPVFALVVVAYHNTPVTAMEPVIPIAYMPDIQAALAGNYLTHERVQPQQAVMAANAIINELA